MAFQEFGNSNVSEQVPASRESSSVDETLPYGFVIRKTFLELVDFEAASSGNARRRVRSLDDKWGRRNSSSSGARSRETPSLSSPPSADVNDTESDASSTRSTWSSRNSSSSGARSRETPSLSNPPSADVNDTESDASSTRSTWSSRNSSSSGARSRETPSLSSPPSADLNGTESDASPTRSTCSCRAGHSESASTTASSSYRVPPTPQREQSANSSAEGRRRNRNRTPQQPVQEWYTTDARAAMAARLESGTTVMVQNLPRDMSQVAFAWAVEGFGFRGLYDFLYMPTCFKSGRSKGYAFVNLLDADLAVSFALTCESRGIRVSRACVQGHAAIKKYLHRLTRRVRNTRHLPIFAHGMLGQTGGSYRQSSVSLKTLQHEDELVTYCL
eukprot:TRINITY_DN6345_c0_g2_i3.p1 TRINITY_DN6345_c0_g2~~TRINITY_DN6345_c0_g2_i3.p1  ORF type:complete len:407 (-),score=46.12 TRINITY_DN6345_c0_g2_i3:778-1941(-)